VATGIRRALEQDKPLSAGSQLYGDGQAAERIVELLAE
jgi:UDP-N-acetylglucosamine 2-epimerase